jgi:zinc D-Ala-D-Ala carboxypeptidase
MNWDKYKPFFVSAEFTCKCGCGLLNMKEDHMDMLLAARKETGIPFVINSGSRCPVHNARVGGKNSSDHLTGEGTDVKCLASDTRMKLVKAFLNAGFNRIGINKTFIHVGNNKANPQNVLFPY